MIYFLTSPYHLTNNPTVNSGATTNLTCTGGATGVPSGAKGVLLGINLYSVVAGGTAQIYPTGGTAGIYANYTPQWAGNNVFTSMGMAVIPISAGGQITVRALNQNMVLQDWYIFGYIM